MKTIIVLYSGGIDSYAGYLWATKEYPHDHVVPMYIHYKGAGCEKEVKYAKALVTNTDVVHNKFDMQGEEIGDHNFLYGRNLYFAAYASQFADVVMLCGLKNSEMTDNVPEFYELTSKTLSQVKGKKVTVMSPFSDMEKEEVVDDLFKTWGDTIGRQIAKTTSCHSPHEQFCWSCPNCLYFVCAVWGHRDKIPLDIKFKNKEMLKRYYAQAMAGELPPKRTESVIQIHKDILEGSV